MEDLLGMDFTAQPNSSNSTSTKTQANYGRTTFDYLAASGSTSTQHTTTRSASPLALSISPNSARPTSPSVQSKPSPSSASSGADAFAGLFGAPSGAGAGAGAGARAGAAVSMAERLAKESAAKIGGLGGINPGSPSWAALNPSRPGSAASAGRSSPAVSLQPTRQYSTSSAASSARATVATSATSTPDPWDFDLLAPTTSTSKPSSISSPSDDPFGLGFGGPSAPPTARLQVSNGGGRTLRKQRSFMDDDGDDNYASNEDGLLSGSGNGSGYAQDEDDDILGALSQPVSQLRVSSPLATGASTPASRASPAPRTTTASPPPHVLGQIVEMGFSIPQASAALQATAGPNGTWSVEAALEALVETQQAEAHSSRRRQAEEWGAEVEAEGGRRGESRDRPRQDRPRERATDEVEPRPTGRRAREAAARERETGARQANGGAEASGSGLVSGATAEQAAELFVQAQKQASKIGFSMFKSASAYVAQGKAAVEKALAEQAEAKAKAGGGKAQSGRPKWMTDDIEDDEVPNPTPAAHQRPAATQSGSAGSVRKPPPSLFQDSDDEDKALPQRPFASAPSHPQHSASRQAPPPDTAPAAYKSPWRTAKAAPALASSLPPAPAPSARRSTPTPSPKPARPPRQAVSVSPAALVSATAHKTKGNDLFKLGRFGDAAAAYSLALADLPAGSLARIPLLSNRAGARLKVGEERVAIEDCSEVIRLILPEGLPGPEGRIDVDGLEQERLSAEVQDVKLVEMLGKALGRRAKAWEAEEQWDKAGQDWELIRKSGEAMTRGAGGPKLVSEGAARCRKATSIPAAAASASATPLHPRSKVVPSKLAVKPSGAAVAAHRANEASAEAEDELRFKIKDSVEARIVEWKAGKEANLRALIASLDTVMWAEVGWVKVGMGELLTEGQVKIRYMKAIAKVHPDKLNVGNTTVEQRMIAGLVFAALNEAWTAQKA